MDMSVPLLLLLLLLPHCEAQGNNCSCSVPNSQCDEFKVCRCDPGWDGERCEHCVPTPGCVHGSCEQPWQCRCEPGWGGRFCDKDLLVCSARRPCVNGASCVVEDSGDYACVCPEGFHGRNCQLKTGPCLQRRSPCRNGGLCEDADGFAAELTCQCLAGFTGPRCETDVDDCLMKPCGNGATCVDGANRFSCLCPAGFTGRFCTFNLDDCASRPCLNAGRCLDRAAGFYCVCPLGYTGATCETPPRSRDPDDPGWEGGGGVRQHLTTGGRNYRTGSNGSGHDDHPFKVTVSERGAAGLSEVQLIVLLVLTVLTLGAVALTAAFVLQSDCRNCGHGPCWTATSSSRLRSRRREQLSGRDCSISFLNATEPEKKKLNTEVA